MSWTCFGSGISIHAILTTRLPSPLRGTGFSIGRLPTADTRRSAVQFGTVIAIPHEH
jgi:hypothetical protein